MLLSPVFPLWSLEEYTMGALPIRQQNTKDQSRPLNSYKGLKKTKAQPVFVVCQTEK